jgi:hypothetical protein
MFIKSNGYCNELSKLHYYANISLFIKLKLVNGHSFVNEYNCLRLSSFFKPWIQHSMCFFIVV